MSTQAVLLFARLPERGRVKTRLARTVGDDVAVEFYAACVEHVLAQVHGLRARRFVFVADPGDVPAMRRWVGRDFEVLPQRGADLGARMKSAFEDVFGVGVRRAVVTATDTPELTADIVRQGLHALDAAPVVLGPSDDGGYYLLGMQSVHDWLFDDMPWSTPDVLDQTRRRIAGAGLAHRELARLPDIDTEADLRAWLARAPDDPLAGRVAALLGAR